MALRVAAVIVVYRPDPVAGEARLAALIAALAGEVETIFLFLNSPVPPGLVARCATVAGPAALGTLGTGDNLGLGRAYNEAAEAARRRGCEALLVFDQDSEPAAGIAGRLAAAFAEAGGRSGRVAAVGPRPISPESGTAYKLPPARKPAQPPGGLRDVSFLISSGSLIDLDAFAAVGPFREDFFIDAIDIEWCFRAASRGYRCVMALGETMPHRLGRGLMRVPLLPVRFVEQPPARLFSFARNQVAMMRLGHVPLWWKGRIAASLALRLALSLGSRQRRREAAALWRGIGRGLRGDFTPPNRPMAE